MGNKTSKGAGSYTSDREHSSHHFLAEELFEYIPAQAKTPSTVTAKMSPKSAKIDSSTPKNPINKSNARFESSSDMQERVEEIRKLKEEKHRLVENKEWLISKASIEPGNEEVQTQAYACQLELGDKLKQLDKEINELRQLQIWELEARLDSSFAKDHEVLGATFKDK